MPHLPREEDGRDAARERLIFPARLVTDRHTQLVATSQSLKHLGTGLKAFAKTTGGKPSAQERSLFVASVALSYAVWENYTEDLAVEAATFIANEIDAAKVPEAAQAFVERDATPWELAVHPGWRTRWVDQLKLKAKGLEGSDRDYGLLTADTKGVKRIFGYAGLDPFEGFAEDQLDKINDLVKLRGTIVHTGKAPDSFYKADAVASRKLVKEVADEVDRVTREQVRGLVGKFPW